MNRKLHMVGWSLLAASCAWGAAVYAAEQKLAPSPEDPMAELGTLTCSLIGEGEGGSTGVARDVTCSFQAGLLGPIETYTGTVQGVGKAELLFGKGAVLLAVKAPQSVRATPGLLAQSYAVDAGASASPFAPLVGEKRKLIVLQPMLEQEGWVKEGKSQPDAVIILVDLKLQSTPA